MERTLLEGFGEKSGRSRKRTGVRTRIKRTNQTPEELCSSGVAFGPQSCILMSISEPGAWSEPRRKGEAMYYLIFGLLWGGAAGR